jgi:FKBP-type peptidyl-prolyl cis-trans isomerase
MPLKMTDITEGTGAMALAGKPVSVHYTGWLFDASAPENKGRKFDSSRDRGEAFGFELGAGQVIAGWDRGVAGMRVGGHRRLTIPPEFGYGARGAGGVIPPNATLVFDVELLGVG